MTDLEELIIRFTEQIEEMEEYNIENEPNEFALQMLYDMKIELRELKFRQIFND